MNRLIDPDDLIDDLDEINEAYPPQWVPEPEPDPMALALLAASTDYDDDIPF